MLIKFINTLSGTPMRLIISKHSINNQVSCYFYHFVFQGYLQKAREYLNEANIAAEVI